MRNMFTSAIAIVAIMTANSLAQSIGVHFPSNRDNAMLAPEEVAGVPGVAQANWNTSDGGADAAANANGSIAGLKDSGGNTTSANVEWTSNGTWNTTNGTATGDAKLMNGYIDAIGADNPFSIVSISDIPYAQYDAYVYFGSDGNGRTGLIADGTTVYGFSTFSNDPNGGGGFDPSDYVQTTDTAGGNPESNYAVFSGLTNDFNFQVEIIRGSNNSGIHAVQIVNIPEPSTFVLTLLGMLSIFAIRRR